MPSEDKMYMYFIAKGGCEVVVKDRISDGFEESRPKGLQPGDHFGVTYLVLSFYRKLL
jgi:hypothetical protein